MNNNDNFSNPDNSSDRNEIGPSKTLQILTLFAHKFLYPDLYTDYNVTEDQFEILLDLLEEKINEELDKVEKEVKLNEELMDDDMKLQVDEQFNCLVDSGELFLESIEEMRIYLERDDELKGKNNLIRGIEMARRADKKLRRSIEIFEELRETH
jgi:DNA-binding transcriptional regulator GbsR (MarR family)